MVACTRKVRANRRVARRRGTVLVVEDDQQLSELLVLMLESEGFDTAAAMDGQAAVKMAAELRPSLITLDLELPLMSGQGVLEELAGDEATSCIPIVVLSSDVEGLRPTHQIRQVLVKPEGVARLVDVVRESLAGPSARTRSA